jgi:long-chain acyl-CoA synthetase
MTSETQTAISGAHSIDESAFSLRALESPVVLSDYKTHFRHWHLAGLLDQAAETFGERIFLSSPRMTYAEACANTRRIACWLRQNGVKRGDRVMILTVNRPEVVLAAFAAARLGAIFVVINPLIKAYGLRQILEECEPAVVFLDETTAELSSEISNAKLVFAGSGVHPEISTRFDELLQSIDPGPENFPGVDVDPVCLVYTSGSTGRQRGVVLSHDNIRFVVAAIQERLNYQSSDTVGVFLPFSFDYGLYQIFLAAQAGASLFIGRPDMIGPEILKILATREISVLPGVPTLFAAILKMLERRPQALPHLRAVTNTGDKLPRAYVDQLAKHFPDSEIFLMFGLTECKRVSILLPEELEMKAGSVGRALANTEVYVIGPAGDRLPPGEIGELVVRGRHVALGYWRADEESKKRFREDSTGVRELFSGDSCSVDEEGFIYFYGRNDFLLKHRGYRISPLEIEEAVCSIPGVTESGVVKSEKDDLLHLFVSVSDPSLTGAGVLTHLQTLLETAKMPDRVHIISELPKTMNRKVDRKQLHQQL